MRSVRIGVDTGGTFTDVVAVDEETGEILTTKTLDPREPGRRVSRGHRKAWPPGTTPAPSSATAPPWPPTGCWRTGSKASGSSPPRASSSSWRSPGRACPTATATRYFWVEAAPDRSRCTWSRPSAGGSTTRGEEVWPFGEEQAARGGPLVPGEGHHRDRGLLPALLRQPEHERRMREVLAAEHPEAVISLSSDVLREYREYERSGHHPGRRGGQAGHARLHRERAAFNRLARRPAAVLGDEVQRRHPVRPRGRQPAHHHGPVRARRPARSARRSSPRAAGHPAG